MFVNYVNILLSGFHPWVLVRHVWKPTGQHSSQGDPRGPFFKGYLSHADWRREKPAQTLSPFCLDGPECQGLFCGLTLDGKAEIN